MKNFIITEMKKLFLVLFSMATCVLASAQDTIRFRNGRVEAGKVAEIGMGKVKYKKASNPDGPLFLLDESEVASIKYQNGVVDTFQVPVQSPMQDVVDEPIQEVAPEVVPAPRRRVVVQAGPVYVDRTYSMSPASYPLSYVRESPSGIAFNGDYISEQEARDLLGNKYYDFVENERRYRSGRPMWIAGSALLFLSAPLAIGAAIEESEVIAQVAATSAVAGMVLIPVGVVRFATGKVRMKRVLKEYNLDYNAKANGSAELKFGVTGSGVGMNLTF